MRLFFVFLFCFVILLVGDVFADFSTGSSYTVAPSPGYSDDGVKLTDDVKSVGAGEWGKIAGWQNVDATIIVDLGEAVTVTGARMYYFDWNGNAGINGPNGVNFYFSEDGTNWSSPYYSSTPVAYDGNVKYMEYLVTLSNIRYVGFVFVRGGEWTFVSEVVVDGGAFPTPTPTPSTPTPTPTPTPYSTPCEPYAATPETDYKFLLALSGVFCGFLFAFGLILAFRG